MKQKESDPNRLVESIKLPNGQSSQRVWIKGKKLGKGGQATVYELKNEETGHMYAVKQVVKGHVDSVEAKVKLMDEIKVHRSLKHPNICQFESMFDDSENFYIVLEYCASQTLFEMLEKRGRLHELEVQCIVR